MNRRHAGLCSRSVLGAVTLGFVQCALAGTALAQAPAPGPAAPPPTPAAPADVSTPPASATANVTVAPPLLPPPPPPTTVIVAPSPPPPPPSPAVPVAQPDANAPQAEKVAHMDQPPPPKPTVAYNFGVRTGIILQDPANPKSMSEAHLDGGSNGAYVEARFHGDLNENFGWVANFNASANGHSFTSGANVGTMDLLGKFRATDAFQIWAGRLLVPSDRSNFAGPFFMSPWNYPGVYGGSFVGPKTGPNGRDQGATIWGMAGPENKFKYYVGAYGIDQPGQAYYSGRLSYAIQGSEPGYFGSSTYYGDASVVNLGIGGQYQKDGSTDLNSPLSGVGGTPTGKKDTTSFFADLLVEEAVAGAGTFSLEGQFYAFNTGQVVGGSATAPIYTPKEAFYVLGSYLTPENIGVGKLQPLVRVQQTIDPGWTVVDAQLGYIMQSYFLKLIANYQHTDAGAFTANALQFGAQLQM